MDRSLRVWPIAAAVFAGVLAVYVATMHPSLPGGDAGELITAAYRLEVAHPPGYPLYTLLAKVFTLIPAGSIAWRVNLLSAVCGAGAAAIMTATVGLATASIPAAIAAGVCFALSPVVWTYATGAEVFALNNLLIATLFFLALLWARGREPRVAYAIAFVLGLALANHHTSVFYALPVALWLLWTAHYASNRPRLFRMAAAGAAGLCPYLYLWLAGWHATELSWGATTSATGLLHHVMRADYGTLQLAAGEATGATSMADSLAAYAAHVRIAAILPLAGAAALNAVIWNMPRFRSRHLSFTSRWDLLLLVCFSFYLFTFHALANLPVDDPLKLAVLSRFWQQADIVVFLLVGLGFSASKRYRLTQAAAWLIVVIVVGAQLAFGYPQQDQSRNDLVARYGRTLLETLPPRALLLTKGDLVVNATRYLQACEGMRADVALLDQELMTMPWYVERAARQYPDIVFPAAVYAPAQAGAFSMREFLDANIGKRPIRVYPEWKEGDASIARNYEAWPMGMSSSVQPVSAAIDIEQWARDSEAATKIVEGYGWPRIAEERRGTWERVVAEDIWQVQLRRGWWLLSKSMAAARDDLVEEAAAGLQAAAQTNPTSWHAFKNLGIAYGRLAERRPELRAQQIAAWERYLALAPPHDPQRDAVADNVRALRGH